MRTRTGSEGLLCFQVKRLSREPWFGPKAFGWGLRPVSWQGWLLTAVLVGGVALTIFGLHRTSRAAALGAVAGELAVYLVVAFLTSMFADGR